MRRSLAALTALVLASCSESSAPRAHVTRLQIHPRYAATAAARASATTPINLIVITARDVASSQVVGSLDQSVDPNATSWDLTLDLTLDGTETRDVALAMELGHADPVSPTVAWSGIVIVSVTPGQDT